MQARVSSIDVKYSVRGVPSYRIEVWHDGLKKHREIKGSDSSVVARKAQLQVEEWNAKWMEVSARLADKAARQAQKQEHESLKQLAAEQTAAAKAEFDNLAGLLNWTLEIDDQIDWDSLKDTRPFPEPRPASPEPPPRPSAQRVPTEPQAEDKAFVPELGFLDKLIPSRKQRKLDEGKSKFVAAHEHWQRMAARAEAANAAAEEEYLAALSTAEMLHQQAVRDWEQRREKYLADQDLFNAAVDTARAAYQSGDADSVTEYCDMVLSASLYPEYLPKEWELEYNAETKTLVVDYVLPAPAQLPTLKEVKYVQSRGEMVESHISESQLSKMYDSALYQIVLRTVHELFEADAIAALDAVTFNGWVTSIDPTTGNETTACVLSLLTRREEFMAINLAAVEPKACFKALKGVGSSKLHSLTAVAPILNIRRDDGRFVAARELANTLDDSVNLASMDWEDFEHLIREIFQAEFSSSGGEVKVTQASRDGGVDAIAFDPDPIRGGKIVIQAKRYTNTVGVSAVRDLYGTVMNEGATKGVLVTTADYGPDAYTFAKDKPLVLLNGGNLLHLLQKHGHRARINIKEAREEALRQPFR